MLGRHVPLPVWGMLVFVVSSVALTGGMELTMPARSKADIAAIATRRIAHHASSWRANHPASCPALDELVTGDSDLDPWGVPYTLICDAHGIVVVSRGEDRLPGTTDDIRSGR